MGSAQRLGSRSTKRYDFPLCEGSEPVVSHDGVTDALPAGPDSRSSIPPMPAVAPSDLYRGSPRLLRTSGLRHSLGWQLHRTAGPGFVVVRLTRLDTIRVISRFALSEQGWESAWRTLSDLDAGAATTVSATLAAREATQGAARRSAELDAGVAARLRWMTYDGGSGAPLTRGQVYDLRFLSDRLTVCLPGSATPVTELPYHDVEALEVGGSDGSKSAGETAAVVAAVALAGALIGLVILGLLGFLLGALLFGMIGALAMVSSAKVRTILRVRSRDSEFFFSKAGNTTEALRIELSQPLLAIGQARSAGRPAPADPAPPVPATIPDQLGKLASLLADGVLTREEFEHLKAKVIAQA